MSDPNDSKVYLLSLSIGPVQDFIAAALRTRDLWFGSHMLSEVSKAAALAVAEKAELIFPGTDLNVLKSTPEINVANRIVAIVKGDVSTVIVAAKEAAHKQLRHYIKEAESICKLGLRKDVWALQADTADLLELYATSVPINNGDYHTARNRLDRLTAARKNTREFYPSTIEQNGCGFGLPKSSLDGRRETVLPDNIDDAQRRILRMGKNEQLDLIGLVKRLAGGKVEQFTPTTRIACDAWIRTLNSERQTEICGALNALKSAESAFVTGVTGNDQIYKACPFDAGLLYQDRLEVALRECRKANLTDEISKLQALRKTLQPIWRKHGQPDPYYVLMLADGDHIGTLLDQAKKKEEHQEIARLLTEFAQSVRATVQKHRGHCIYAGGDDVFAMVPVESSLALADELRRAFHQKLKTVAEKLGAEQPTFSVGLVMAHMQAPLGRVRRLAKEAEQLAKGGETDSPRNALGIIVAPRSGAPLALRLDWGSDPLQQIGSLAKLYQTGELSHRFGYELRESALLLNGVDKAFAEEIKQLEMKRILSRKNEVGGTRSVSQTNQQAVLKHAKNKSIDRLFNEHLIARWLGQHAGKARP
ncbi:MAG: type III-B CRISPR-associated protein Cas10/Cmr2 [Candidatus Polarisedimenticolaceae bacterium]|nr:type III-B CRISPR-associated protein Cas10/Cmr2 [Candidatus Polarisedimenticolaceae bacterium]